MKPAAHKFALFAILMAFLVAGCGKAGAPIHHAPPPPDTSFADIAGVYQATVTQASGDIAGQMHAGDCWWVTITAAGRATANTGAPPTSDYGQIQRLGNGSFTTAAWSIPGGKYEQATAPADLSTMKLESTRLSVLYGRVIFALVKVSGG